MGRGRRSIDPLGEDVLDVELEQEVLTPIVSATESPGIDHHALQMRVVQLQDQLDATKAELELMTARAEAAEGEIAGRADLPFNPNVPHIAKEDYACIIRSGGGTLFLKAGQVIKDPLVIKMLHGLGAPIVRQ